MPLLGARRHMARAIAHLHRWPRTTCYSLLAGVGVGAGAGAAVAAAQQEYVEVPPTFNATHYPNGINANFVNGRPTEAVISDFAGPAGRFENEETRDIARAWPALVKLVRATVPLEGRVLADIGAGTGLFMAPFREAVGARGSVVAVELSPHFVKHLEAKGADYPNVSVVQCTDRSTELRDESVDVAFICDVYHHLAYPGTFMRSLHRALKPGGHVVLVDFHRIPGLSKVHARDWVLVHVRAGQDVFRQEVLEAGFDVVAEPVCPELTENYCMIFAKPS